MAPLTNASRVLSRAASRCCAAPGARALSTTPAVAQASATYESPFKGADKMPDWSHYMAKGPGGRNQLFSYFMVGAMGAISAAGAKETIHGEFCVWALKTDGNGPAGMSGEVNGAGDGFSGLGCCLGVSWR